MKKLIIIDGHNFLWRAYSAPFKFFSKNGTPLHTATMYLKLVRRVFSSIKKFAKSDLVVVVFDTDTTNDNFKLSDEYKANRKKVSEKDNPYQHIPYIQKTLNFLNIKYLEIANVEADDIIASIAKSFCKRCPTNKVYIISSDTDFYQLLGRQISILKLKSGNEYEILKPKHIKNKLGITPKQYVYFKSLTGDSADNIRGISGIGKITARKIVRQEIKFNINRYKKTIDLNKKLITLNCNCKKQWNFRDFSHKPKLLKVSNNEIFKYCKF
jgi:DNA polymerase-1